MDVAHKHPDLLFLIGDNLRREGHVNQACIRNANVENVVGIATTGITERDKKILNAILEQDTMDYLKLQSRTQKPIILPFDGIGNGVARLDRHPVFWDLSLII